MVKVLHFAQADDTSGYFPQLAKRHDHSKSRMYFGTLNRMAPWLRDVMAAEGVGCFDCGCRTRTEYPLGLLRLVRFLRRAEIDVFHAHLFEPAVIGLPAAVLAGTRVRILTRHYSDYHTRIDRRWHTRLDQLCTTMSHAVIAVSRHTAQHLVEREGAPPEKVHVVLNGIDFERVRPSDPRSRERLRSELNVGESYVLLTAARLHPEKGYEHLFAALPGIMAQLDRRCVLLIAGTSALEAHYRELARSLGLEAAVRFLGYRTDIADLMLSADLFVLASVAEAFGLVLAEALYLGVPVVATRVGGIPEIVDDGVDGVLVPPGDSAALAQAVVELLRNPGRRAALAGAGRAKVERRFRFVDMMRSYERIYEELLAR